MNMHLVLLWGFLAFFCNVYAMEKDEGRGAKRPLDELSSEDSSSDEISTEEPKLTEEQKKAFEQAWNLLRQRTQAVSQNLVKSVLGNDPEGVRQALAAGANANMRAEGNKTLLMIALERGYKEVAELLLAHFGLTIDPFEIDPSTQMSLLGYAIRQNYEDIVDKILQKFILPDPSESVSVLMPGGVTPVQRRPTSFVLCRKKASGERTFEVPTSMAFVGGCQMLAQGLAEAVRLDKPYFVRKFLALGAPYEMRIGNQNTLEFAVTQRKAVEMIRLLVNAAKRDYPMLLKLLLDNGYRQVVLELLNDPNFTIRTNDVEYALEKNDQELIATILKRLPEGHPLRTQIVNAGLRKAQ